jgi:hypothetical protein
MRWVFYQALCDQAKELAPTPASYCLRHHLCRPWTCALIVQLYFCRSNALRAGLHAVAHNFWIARHPLETGGRFLLKCLKKELRMILRKVGFLLFLMLAASAALGSSETAFETFKGFEGKWAIRSGQKTLSIEMTYQVGSKGSIVTEQFGKELSVLKLI